MLRMFGLGEGERTEFGWGHADQGSKNTDVGSFLTRYHFHPSSYVQREEVLMPYLGVLSSFRDGIRQLAMSKGENNLKDILTMCDKLRDDDLVPLGVALDDQDGGVLRFFLLLLLTNHHNWLDGKALIKLVPPAELIKARDEKRIQQEERAQKKAQAILLERQKRLEKIERGRLPPHEMFKPPNVSEEAYGSWDGAGFPLTTGEGVELSKNQIKNLHKKYQIQEKLHQEFLKWQESESLQ